MTNADKFKRIFGIRATELWAKPEKEFLEWLNADVPDTNVDDTIHRQAAIDALLEEVHLVDGYYVENDEVINKDDAIEAIQLLPSAQHEIIRCKDCKHWKDSDGVYRRGFDAESKCPINIHEVYEGTFYCGFAERRTDENKVCNNMQ